jgi:hypothetical protein
VPVKLSPAQTGGPHQVFVSSPLEGRDGCDKAQPMTLYVSPSACTRADALEASGALPSAITVR